MLNVTNLIKKYGDDTALDGITFSVEPGNVLGLLGPNGAGKTTTMRILCGYIVPDGGKAEIEGYDTAVYPFEIKKLVGYLPEDNPLYREQTALEYLLFCAGIRGMSEKAAGKSIRQVSEVCGIEGVLERPIAQLSKGYRKRIGIAQAILHDPPILILDEPTTGLDPNQILEIRALIGDLGKNKTIILSTHIMQEVRALCGRIVIINRGKIVADGLKDRLLDEGVEAGIDIVMEGPDEEIKRELESIKDIGSVRLADGCFRVVPCRGCDPRRDIFKMASERGWPIMLLRPAESDLERVFAELTGDGR